MIKIESRVIELFEPNHGSSLGNLISVTQYFNPVKCRWQSDYNGIIRDLNELKQ